MSARGVETAMASLRASELEIRVDTKSVWGQGVVRARDEVFPHIDQWLDEHD